MATLRLVDASYRHDNIELVLEARNVEGGAELRVLVPLAVG